MSLKPLAGIRVLDFTAVPPGAMCTVMLADLGAEVIRVEAPALKGRPSTVVGQAALSRGKRSLTLDRRNPASKAVLERLLAAVDVIVEGARPGSSEASAFTYEEARAANPRVVWCSMTSFGQDGPYAELSGHDLSFVAHSGFLAAISQEMPWHPAVMLAAQAGAYAAVVGIQGALIERARSGEGAFIDISLSEATGFMLTAAINPLAGQAMAIPVTPDRRLYACSDGRYLAVASCEPRTWAALCDALEVPQLKDALHKPDRAAETTAALEAAFAARFAAEWATLLAKAGASAHVVNRGRELLDDPQVRARGSVVDCGGVPVPASPFRIAAPGGARSETAAAAPPTVGEQTDETLLSAGFSNEEIAALRETGVI